MGSGRGSEKGDAIIIINLPLQSRRLQSCWSRHMFLSTFQIWGRNQKFGTRANIRFWATSDCEPRSNFGLKLVQKLHVKPNQIWGRNQMWLKPDFRIRPNQIRSRNRILDQGRFGAKVSFEAITNFWFKSDLGPRHIGEIRFWTKSDQGRGTFFEQSHRGLLLFLVSGVVDRPTLSLDCDCLKTLTAT